MPSVFDLAKTDEQRQILALWAAPNKMGRPFFAPPGMAEERAALMRRAFDATMARPGTARRGREMNLAVDGISGGEVEALHQAVYATPKAVVEKAAIASKGRVERKKQAVTRTQRCPTCHGVDAPRLPGRAGSVAGISVQRLIGRIAF